LQGTQDGEREGNKSKQIPIILLSDVKSGSSGLGYVLRY